MVCSSLCWSSLLSGWDVIFWWYLSAILFSSLLLYPFSVKRLVRKSTSFSHYMLHVSTIIFYLKKKGGVRMIFCFFFITTKGNLIAFYYILRITDNGYYEQTTQITTNSKDHDGVWKTGIKSFLVVTSAKFVLFWNFLFICFYQICRISLNFKTWMLLLLFKPSDDD